MMEKNNKHYYYGEKPERTVRTLDNDMEIDTGMFLGKRKRYV